MGVFLNCLVFLKVRALPEAQAAMEPTGEIRGGLQE